MHNSTLDAGPSVRVTAGAVPSLLDNPTWPRYGFPDQTNGGCVMRKFSLVFAAAVMAVGLAASASGEMRAWRLEKQLTRILACPAC
jgi:hypothetical protein